jgi:hypothetical protein
MAIKGVAETIPERVGALLGVELSDGVRPALLDELVVRRAAFRAKKGVVHPPLWFVDVDVGRNDVVVTREDDGCFALHEFCSMKRQSPIRPITIGHLGVWVACVLRSYFGPLESTGA